MEENKLFFKAKKKLVALLAIYLCIALALIGFVALKIFSDKNEEVEDLSELVLNNNVKEGQYVKLEIDTLPIVLMQTSNKDIKFYYVTDVNNHTYIMSLSGKTFNNILKTLDSETGKLKSAYQLKGTTNNISEYLKETAISVGFKVFGYEELNSDNFSQYLGDFYIKEKIASERMSDIYTILVLLGVFFLILALGHILPAIIKISKGNFGIYDEKNMYKALEKYLPEGEILTHGIICVGIETHIKQAFGKCICVVDKIMPDENGTTVQVTKSKYAKFNVYIGITGQYLIFAECEEYKHFYEFDDLPDMEGTTVKEIDTIIPIKDIGTCFPLAEIQNCTIENKRNGNVICSITMKNGSLLKLMLPKQGGLGMPHHEEYREAIMARLNKGNI